MSHYNTNSLEAISAGKVLFCEKPLTLSLADADEILEAPLWKMPGHLARSPLKKSSPLN